MKTCPTCKARCFEDMEVCYGCMHRFEAGDGSDSDPVMSRSSDKAESLPIAKKLESVPMPSPESVTSVALPDVAAPASGSESGPLSPQPGKQPAFNLVKPGERLRPPSQGSSSSASVFHQETDLPGGYKLVVSLVQQG